MPIALVTNAGVHVAMHAYHLSSSGDCRWPLHWKRAVTELQIARSSSASSSLASSSGITSPTVGSRGCSAGSYAAFNASLLALFINFRLKAYKEAKNNPKKVIAASTASEAKSSTAVILLSSSHFTTWRNIKHFLDSWLAFTLSNALYPLSLSLSPHPGIDSFRGDRLIEYSSRRSRRDRSRSPYSYRRKSRSSSPRWHKSRSPSPRRRISRSPSLRRHKRRRSRSMSGRKKKGSGYLTFSSTGFSEGCYWRQKEAELKLLEEETARRIEEAIRKKVEEFLNSDEVKLEIQRRIVEGRKKLFDEVEAQLEKEKEEALIEARKKAEQERKEREELDKMLEENRRRVEEAQKREALERQQKELERYLELEQIQKEKEEAMRRKKMEEEEEKANQMKLLGKNKSRPKLSFGIDLFWNVKAVYEVLRGYLSTAKNLRIAAMNY
ncbi:hypothetical protein OPV22_012582 [Ensete ventricosum]|uniref:Arginine and glutamate-rich protein 1 n=1 Tax=Ensete ventricosum TaxID=4639 RepID=A0AAV8R7X0_ENSVE|nr:hypothetical protein OPV22_012582 [Ensete ventricosum]